MQCAESQWDDQASYLKYLRAKVFRERVPLYASIELTRRCNLSCIHCYLGPSSDRETERELATDEFLGVIDQTSELGCLFLLLTGGEPLLRRDFAQLYRRAKLNGMLVTVFTNGTTVTERIADLFADLPPQAVEISLYGASAETYEVVTGRPGAFEQCLRGIERLVARRIRVKLKTMLMKPTVHELQQMEKLAESYSLPFRSDPVVSPSLEGDRSLLQFRLSPEIVVEKELDTEAKREGWSRYLDEAHWVVEADRLYNCAAGQNTFHVTATGFMQPCLMVTEIMYNVRDGELRTGWHSVLPRIREKKMPVGLPCNQCEVRTLCSYCPPAFQAESGDEPPSFHCEVSRRRLQVLTERKA